MSSENTLRYSSGIIVFKKTFPQQTLNALPTNTAWWLTASNRSTLRCVFHRATYKDVGMALNLNRLIVSAPLCTLVKHSWDVVRFLRQFVTFQGRTTQAITLSYFASWWTAVAQWLRCCATNRKVAGSIPAGVIGFFIDIKSFLGSTQPLTEMSATSISWG